MFSHSQNDEYISEDGLRRNRDVEIGWILKAANISFKILNKVIAHSHFILIAVLKQ